MSEEIEIPLEKVQEDMHHHLHSVEHGSGNAKLMTFAAVLSAFLAVFAAVSALMAGHAANEAVLLQLHSSDQWSFYQAKGIKLSIAELNLRLDQTQVASTQAVATPNEKKTETAQLEDLSSKIDRYRHEQAEIKLEADNKETESKLMLEIHERFATAVTFFQVSIALTAIAVLTKRGQVLYFSGLLGLCGLTFMILALLQFQAH
jgi:lipopolysaccharide export LptBFGC system permease protein LptF